MRRSGDGALYALLRETHQLLRRNGGVGDKLHIRAGDFAELGFRLAYRSHERDPFVAGQCFFNDGGVDVVPAPNDQILGAARDPNVAVLIQLSEIARAQPVRVGIKTDVFFGIDIGSARKHARAGHANLAHLARLAFPDYGSVVLAFENSNLRVRHRNSHRADFAFPVQRIDGNQASRFGQTVSFEDFDACSLFEPVEQFDRQRSRTAKRRVQRGDVRIDRSLHQRGRGGRNGCQEADFPSFNQFPEVVEHSFAPVSLRGRKYDV